jgi:hypothetical protein
MHLSFSTPWDTSGAVAEQQVAACGNPLRKGHVHLSNLRGDTLRMSLSQSGSLMGFRKGEACTMGNCGLGGAHIRPAITILLDN